MTKDFDERNEKKSRSVCAAMAEAADTGKRALSEREKRILDMWPRYEDGEPVMPGDRVGLVDGGDEVLCQVHVGETGYSLYTETHDEWHDSGDVVKRPAPKVLDADGVPIRVGDTVWHEDGTMLMVDGFGGIEDGETIVNVHVIRGATPWREVRSLSLTHTRPDSWERLEEDAAKHPCDYAEVVKGSAFNDCGDCPWWGECGGRSESEMMARDIIRRAKKLAGVER